MEMNAQIYEKYNFYEYYFTNTHRVFKSIGFNMTRGKKLFCMTDDILIRTNLSVDFPLKIGIS